MELTDGRSADGKHKVFWLQPCESPSPNPSGSTPGGPGSPSENPSGTPGGPGSPGGGAGGGGSLPITGVAATGIAVTGVALIGGGVALMTLRRRRDRITFTN